MYQTLIFVGNLGRDPEMRYTPAGKAVTSFSVAASRSYNNQAGEKVDETTWFRVTAWEKQAEVCNQYLHKGSKVLVEGRLVPDVKGGPKVFQRQDGTWGASFEVIANTVRFLSAKGEGSGDSQGDDVMEGDSENLPTEPDDVPAAAPAAATHQAAPTTTRQVAPAPRPTGIMHPTAAAATQTPATVAAAKKYPF